MSEASDDAQLAAKDEAVLPAALETASDADDVEVVAQSPEPEAEPAPTPRHDSVLPTSRKLAPPPKPKRDSNHPGSNPPPASEVALNAGSLKAPSTPSISFQDASLSSRDAVAAALTGSDSLRAIGEALAKDAGAFSTSESATGSRPPVPRPRSQPAMNAVAADAPNSGMPETRPSQELLKPRSASEPPRARDKVPTVPDEPVPSAPAPKSTAIFAQRIIRVGTHSERPAPRPPAAAPVDLDRTLEAAPEPPPPPAVVRAPSPVPPPPAEVLAALAVDVPVDEAPPEIPVTHEELDEDTPTTPSASPGPLATPPPPPLVSAPSIPDEPTPAPPVFAAAEAVAPAEALAAEDVAPDSADRIPVEELSREDSPSLPPEEMTPMMPPPAPSGRPEAKAEAKPQPPPPPKRAPAAEPGAPAVEPTAREITSPEGEKKKSKQKRAWWEELFSEDFVRANWKVSDEQIKREVTFVEESLGVAPGGVVLDLGCGSGQHAVELASRGYGVVGYDLSLYQLALAADIAQERSQKLNFLQGDMREMAFEEMFDGIFCWNTSFGYFEEDKNFSVAERAFRALRPGGMFLVDVINRDFVAAHTPSSVWFEGDSCVCMDDAVIDYFTSRLRVKRSVILDDGRTRECTYSVRLYSFHELGKLLHEVGFRVTEVSGHPATPGVFLGQASPRILMLAQRP
jgi:SAM-dependent methyltransferase